VEAFHAAVVAAAARAGTVLVVVSAASAAAVAAAVAAAAAARLVAVLWHVAELVDGQAHAVGLTPADALIRADDSVLDVVQGPVAGQVLAAVPTGGGLIRAAALVVQEQPADCQR